MEVLTIKSLQHFPNRTLKLKWILASTFLILSISLEGQTDVWFQKLMAESDAEFNKGEFARAYQRYAAISWAYDKPEQSHELRDKIQLCRDSISILKSRLQSKIWANEQLQHEYENQCLELAILKGKIAWLVEHENERPNNFNPAIHLHKIDLSDMGLTRLPEGINLLSNLREIDLSGNVFVDQKQVLRVLNDMKFINSENLNLQFLTSKQSLYKATLDSLTNELIRLTLDNQAVPNEYYEKDSALNLFKRGKYIDALLFYDLIIDHNPNFKSSLIPFQILVLESIKLNINTLKEQKEQSDKIQENTYIVLFDRGNRLVNPYEIKSCRYYHLSDYKKIKELSFLDFELKLLPPQVEHCTNLEYINLIGNTQIDWKRLFNILPQKTKIFVSFSCVDLIPTKYIDRVAGFKMPDVNQKQVSGLPKNKAIEYIEIGDIHKNNSLDSESLNEILNNRNLKHLSLNSCNITELPADISQLKNLKRLDLIGNQLSTLPEEISELNNLEELNLSSNKFEDFPSQLKNLPNLKKLTLTGNEILIIPKDVEGMESLQELNIEYNLLREIVDEVGSLKHLTSLDLSGNQLQKLPENLSSLKNLKNLNLKSNQFEEFPSQILRLSELQSLNLSNNNINEIPEDVYQLKNLKELNLMNNHIEDLPTNFKKLNTLIYLDLSFNEIRYIYNSVIWEMKNIETLILVRNDIRSIPDKLYDMPNLQIFDIRYNPIEHSFRTDSDITIIRD